MPDFGIFRGFNEKLFGDKLVAGQLPTQLGLIGSQEVRDYVYLLDQYPNAAVAYSLRLLREAYTGDAIRVRRASDNAEQDIGFVNNELDTSTLETFCSGTDGFVKTWYDQSGNGYDATNTTASQQPQIVSSGSYLGYMQLPTTNGVLGSSFNYSGVSFSAFMVVQNIGNSVFGGTSAANYFYAVAENGSSSSSWNNFATPTYYSNGTNIGNTRNDIFQSTVNLSLLTTLSSSGGFALRIGYFLSGGFNNFRVSEYIIYDNQTVSRIGVETNIMTHYGF